MHIYISIIRNIDPVNFFYFGQILLSIKALNIKKLSSLNRMKKKNLKMVGDRLMFEGQETLIFTSSYLFYLLPSKYETDYWYTTECIFISNSLMFFLISPVCMNRSTKIKTNLIKRLVMIFAQRPEIISLLTRKYFAVNYRELMLKRAYISYTPIHWKIRPRLHYHYMF